MVEVRRTMIAVVCCVDVVGVVMWWWCLVEVRCQRDSMQVRGSGDDGLIQWRVGGRWTF